MRRHVGRESEDCRISVVLVYFEDCDGKKNHTAVYTRENTKDRKKKKKSEKAPVWRKEIRQAGRQAGIACGERDVSEWAIPNPNRDTKQNKTN